MISAVFDREEPQTVEEKRQFLLSSHVALWDVIGSCEIVGSADSSIRNAVPNDLRIIFDVADIHAIFVNGKTAQKYYNKYARDILKRDAICLPSTSPANAAWSLDRLIEAWRALKL